VLGRRGGETAIHNVLRLHPEVNDVNVNCHLQLEAVSVVLLGFWAKG